MRTEKKPRGKILKGELLYPGWMNLKSKKNRAIIKKYLAKRDGKFCALCKRAVMSTRDLTIDHITEKGVGGTDHINNLQIAHAECNFAKSNKRSPYLKRAIEY